MLRRCPGGVIAIALLLLLRAKQDQDMYLAGQLLPSFLSKTCDRCVQNGDLAIAHVTYMLLPATPMQG